MISRRSSAVVTIALLIPLVVYAVAGWFSRLMADDFCYAVNLHIFGFPGVIEEYYNHWFGRLTQIVGATVGSGLGVGFAAIFPAFLLVLWLIGLLWACREVLRTRLLHANVIMLALLILYATLAGSPQIFHSLYWISGVFPYTVPLVALTFDAALTFRAWRTASTSPLAIFACILLVLIAVWSSEPVAVAVAGGLGLAVIGVYLFIAAGETRRVLLIMLSSALIAAIIGLIILVAAPGNTARQGLFTGMHDPVGLVTQSLSYAAASIVVAVVLSPSALLLSLILPAAIAYTRPPNEIARRTLRIAVALTLLAAFALLVMVNVPAIYATSLPPPARAGVINQFILVIAFVIVGWLSGMYARKSIRRPLRTIVAVGTGILLIAGPLLTTWSMIALLPRLITHANEWDQREAFLREAAAQGQLAIEVAPLSVDVAVLTGLETVGSDPDIFPNACVASYYGLESVTVVEARSP